MAPGDDSNRVWVAAIASLQLLAAAGAAHRSVSESEAIALSCHHMRAALLQAKAPTSAATPRPLVVVRSPDTQHDAQ